MSIQRVCRHIASGHGVGFWNLDLRLIMLSGKEKVLLRILYIVQSLRNSLRSRVVGSLRI